MLKTLKTSTNLKHLTSSSTLTLKDLAKLDFSGTSLAVLGSPIKHSLSPLLHQTAFEYIQHKKNLLFNWHYYRFRIEPQELEEALNLFHKKAFKGLNITLPHKQLALKWASSLHPQAEFIGACNTLLHTPEGYQAYNTDVNGFEHALTQSLKCNPKGKSCLILGGGGSARSVLYSLLRNGISSVYVFSRSAQRFASLQALTKQLTPSTKLYLEEITCFPIKNYPSVDLIINTTPLGLSANDPMPLILKRHTPEAILDLVYHPQKTPWVQTLIQQGYNATDGLSMLIGQGLEALKLWSNIDITENLFYHVHQKLTQSLH